MAPSAEFELRANVSAALDRLNRDHGGRYLGRVADALAVNRSSVARWLRREAAPTFERCLELAELYPTYFDRSLLIELQARAALGEAAQPSSSAGTITQRGFTWAETYTVLAEALERKPATEADREILQTSLEFETDGNGLCFGFAGGTDPDTDSAEVERYLAAVRRRAEQGWRVRLVVNASVPPRFTAVDALVNALEGPDVEIRSYPEPVPRVISPIVVARRNVYLVHWGGRTDPSAPALLCLDSQEAVAWSTRYFDALFNEAPLRLRTPRGVSIDGLSRLRVAVEGRR